MQFLNPSAFIFSSLLAVIVFLYFLKLKRRNILVPSTMLWRKSIDDMRANAPFQRLRRSLLLLLQLLIVSLAVLGLARPYMQMKGALGQSFVLLIDNSASMQATDVGKSRLDEAKKAALQIIDDMSVNDSMMLITFSAGASVRSTFTRDKTALRDALNEIEAVDTRTTLKDALLVALSSAGSRENAEIFVLSDGGTEGVDKLPEAKAEVHFVSFGERGNNVGIVGLETRRNMEVGRGHQIFVNLENFGEEDVTTVLEMRVDDELLDAKELVLKAKSRAAKVFERRSNKRGIVTVAIDHDDDLAVDNTAWTVVRPPTTTDVLLVTNRNYFLEKVLNLDPHVKVFVMPPAKYAEAPELAAQYDVVVFDNYSPEELVAGRYAFFNAAPPLEGASTGEKITQPVIVDWDRSHPVSRFVNFDTLTVFEARAIELPKPSAHLVDAGDVSLISVFDQYPIRAVVIAFDIYASDWPFRVSFPIFVSNMLEWLTRTSEDRLLAHLSTGEVLTLRASAEVEQGELVDPRGNVASLDFSGDGVATSSAARYAGLYKMTIGDRETTLAANLLDRRESDTTPREKLTLGAEEVEKERGTIRTNREIWKHLALAAFVVLLVEWYVYNRKAWG